MTNPTIPAPRIAPDRSHPDLCVLLAADLLSSGKGPEDVPAFLQGMDVPDWEIRIKRAMAVLAGES